MRVTQETRCDHEGTKAGTAATKSILRVFVVGISMPAPIESLARHKPHGFFTAAAVGWVSALTCAQ